MNSPITKIEFQQGLEKLAQEFPGNQIYGAIRLEMLYRECRHLSPDRFKDLIEFLASSCRFLPTVDDFRNGIARSREIDRDRNKAREATEARAFFRCSYPEEERQMICRTIIDRLQGNIPAQEWDDFMDGLKHTAGGI